MQITHRLCVIVEVCDISSSVSLRLHCCCDWPTSPSLSSPHLLLFFLPSLFPSLSLSSFLPSSQTWKTSRPTDGARCRCVQDRAWCSCVDLPPTLEVNTTRSGHDLWGPDSRLPEPSAIFLGFFYVSFKKLHLNFGRETFFFFFFLFGARRTGSSQVPELQPGRLLSAMLLLYSHVHRVAGVCHLG